VIAAWEARSGHTWAVPEDKPTTAEQLEYAQQTFRRTRTLEDDALIALAGRRSIRAGHYGITAFEMEMQRRLKDAVEALTGELVTSREAADKAARQADEAAGKLTRLTGWLIGFTVAVVFLTVVLVFLTVRLLAKG
jgi:hypothetical protein